MSSDSSLSGNTRYQAGPRRPEHPHPSRVNTPYHRTKFFNVGKKSVRAHWDRVVALVEAEGLVVKRIPEEYCVYDDCPEIDDPWVVLPVEGFDIHSRQIEGAVHAGRRSSISQIGNEK